MNVAFIPVRGGSKSIPLKNIKIINKRPLVYWTVLAACECNLIDKVYVATDSDDIKRVVNEFCCEDKEKFNKVEVIGRSEESACDTASTEFAMLEFADNYDFDNIVLIQATSPMLEGKDLDNGFDIFMCDGTDSVLSAVAQKRFFWNITENGVAKPSNYDVYNRPRRQDFEEYYVENGAFYITSKEALLKTRNRVSGNIKIVPMSEDSFYEIDEPSDWTVVEALMKKREESRNGNREQSLLMKKYKMFLTDCDGCLTDGGMYYSEKGDELKKFNTRDGMAFKILKGEGILTGIVTGESVELNRRRAEKLGIDIFISGCTNKLEQIKNICDERGIDLSDVIYLGDDINDLEVIKAVGMGCCPSDANKIILEAADYIAKTKGGEGVIREITDGILNM